MLSKFNFLILCFLFWGCLNTISPPSYNPFDEEYKVSIKTLLKDGCELLYQPCGYKTFGKEIEGNIIYYQFSPGEENEACAKGICIHIDSISIGAIPKESQISKNKHIDNKSQELLASKVDTAKITLPLLNFGLINVSDLEIDSENRFFLEEQEQLTGNSHLNRIWHFKDQKGKIYPVFTDSKIGYNANEESIVIRMVEIFVSE